ncbi:protein kinase [Wenzhouxiangella sp. XN79A]|uniref:protein kinase domain-containing protein n=1 Tax=Wenzhouxiangella sp. XN79A TaxID=2724193 RepID=UPI00144AD737|nr:protein kinase [Wenzhouxiangella sp. XN79A]NKI35050.1 protein kinase [Wenzhouxiangella sp. XN79A]
MTEATWREAAEWFDRLAERPAAERARILDGEQLSPEAGRLLDRLLRAHDAPEPSFIDRTVGHMLAGELLADDATPPPADWTGIRIGHWRVTRELQRGGMATVVLAERNDGQYQRRVALKVLHAALGTAESGRRNRRSLEHELRLLAGLAHPGIVHLLDGGVSDEGWPYLVMEYVDGEPIDVWCDRNAASLELRIELLRQVAAAVAHAHARLIVHADLKPSNVLVDTDGRARLVDFGIARLLDRDEADRTRARLHCSPGWAAPEQLAGVSPSVATDIHGLGMLMYRLLTGRPPRSASAATRALLGQPLEPSPGRPSEHPDRHCPARRLRGDLDAICITATAEDPEQRYHSAEAFERDLDAWQAQRPVRARPAGTADRVAKWLRRNRGLALAGGLAIVSLTAGATIATWQAVRAQHEAAAAIREADRAETIKEFLLTMLVAADPWQAGGNELDMRDVLRQGSLQAETDQALDPATRAELLITLGDVQVALGWHDDAAAEFDRAEALIDAHPDLSPLLRARLWLERAVLEGTRKDYRAQAAALDRMRELLPPPDRPEARALHLRLWSGYASVHANLNRPEAMDDAIRRAEALLADMPDPPLDAQRELQGARVILGFNQGDLEAAYAAALASLEIQRRMGNEEAANMVNTLSNLAAVAAQLGRLDEALEHDRSALELALETYPEGHPAIARTRYSLGDTLRQRGRFDEALALLDEAAAAQQRPGLEIEQALTNLTRARTLLALGRGARAAETAVLAREVLEQAWGATTPAAIQMFDVELAGLALAGADDAALDAATALAAERLDRMESPARWQSLPQALRWRIARIAFERGDRVTAAAWMDESARAPAEVVGHPSTTLRLLGLQLRLADHDATGSALIERIEEALAEPAAADDARAYALCSIASRFTGRESATAARQRLDALIRTATLSQEGQRDAACRSVAEDPGRNGGPASTGTSPP